MNFDLPGSPVRFNAKFNRRLRQDDLGTLGTATLTLTEAALDRGDWPLVCDLATYLLEEVGRSNAAIRAWLQNLFDQGFKQPSATRLLQSNGLESLHESPEFVCARRDQAAMREYLATVHQLALTHHDQLVTCVQSTLTDLAHRLGEQAVFDSIEHTSQVLWSPRMANWLDLSLSERVWLSAEAMRGHLSGPGRRGELRVFDESEAIVLELDPCGCCGVLRRGATPPASNLEPHVLTGQRTGFGWYATHVPITMMYLPLRSGSPPYRAFEHCDTALACRWLIEKVPALKHAHHAAQMGLPPAV